MTCGRNYGVWLVQGLWCGLAIVMLPALVGCGLSIAEWKTTSAESTSSFSFLPMKITAPGESAAVEMARLFQERDVLRERIELQAEERVDVDAQIEVVEAQIKIIPLFADQERRLTVAFNNDAVTTERAQAATDMIIEGNQLINSMSDAQKARNDSLEESERAALVTLTNFLRTELDKLGV